jgi:hypothetical protein
LLLAAFSSIERPRGLWKTCGNSFWGKFGQRAMDRDDDVISSIAGARQRS